MRKSTLSIRKAWVYHNSHAQLAGDGVIEVEFDQNVWHLKPQGCVKNCRYNLARNILYIIMQ